MGDILGNYVTGPAAANPGRPVMAIHLDGRVRRFFESFTLSGAAQNDVLVAGKISSDAVLTDLSRLRNAALGAGVTLKIGVRHPKITTVSAASSLIANNLAAGTATTHAAYKAGIADEGKTLKQLLGDGVPEDFADDLEVIVTIGGAVPNDGTVVLELFYVDH
ncbi:MAG: hypothetical protein AAGF20_00365 [Pseudomonadota bacterium]